MKLAAAKLPVTTEVIDKTSVARLGFEAVAKPDFVPRTTTRGEQTNLLKQAVEAAVAAGLAEIKGEVPQTRTS